MSGASRQDPRRRRSWTVTLLALALALAAEAVEARPWAWLGVRIRDISEREMEEISARHGIREGFGVLIVEVIEGTPAARAGLEPGDLVVAVGERPVTETRLLQRLIARAPIGAESRLTVLREQGRQELRVRLAAMPIDVSGDRVAAEFGFGLREGAPAEPGALPDAPPAVAAVRPDSPAEAAGLQVGDLVLQVAERPVATRDAAREALATAPLDEPLRLAVRRADQPLVLTLRPARPPRGLTH